MFSKKKETLFDFNDFCPALKEVVSASGIEPHKLSVAFKWHEREGLVVENRQRILISDSANHVGEWPVNSIRELFRGNNIPPSLEKYPPEYVSCFNFIEHQLIGLCEAMGDRRDKEMEEIYTALKKRPDGRSLGPVHDFIWQLAATVLGMRSTSQREFEALMGRLAKSSGTFAMGAGSRNYLFYLRNTFGKV